MQKVHDLLVTALPSTMTILRTAATIGWVNVAYV